MSDSKQPLSRPTQLEPDSELHAVKQLNSRARTEGSDVFLEVLVDRDTWNQSGQTVQDLAIQDVDRRLGSDYRYIDTKIFSCGGQSHRIAAFEHCATGMLLNLIPGGKYFRGADDYLAYDSEQPVMEVTVPALLIGQTPVIQKVWDQFGGEDERAFHGEQQPIHEVSWESCVEWLKKIGSGLRLPTETEWEFACRAGTQSRYCFGDRDKNLDEYAWVNRNSEYKPQDVKQKKPNAFGLFDVHGGVFEWCQDWYSESYGPEMTDHKANAPVSEFKVLRGGSFGHYPRNARSTVRFTGRPNTGQRWFGFRVARSLE